MIRWLADRVMDLAIACLPDRDAAWGAAMRAEYRVAAIEGAPLSFAAGCLVAAGRQLLACEEGWLAIAGYAVVLALLLPMAALQLGCALFELPYLYPDGGGLVGALVEGRTHEGLIRGTYQAAIPALATVQLVLGAAHVGMAWTTLDGDWPRVRRLATVAVAATVTLVLLMLVLWLDGRQALLQAAILAVELAAIRTVAWRQHRSLTSIVPDR